MRVFLVMLILSLLPLQFLAAASVACCGHETAPQNPQSMHHQSAQAQPVASAQDTVTVSSGFHLDCGACHANCAAAISAGSVFMIVPAGAVQVELATERMHQRSHEQPYRPQWSTPNGSGMRSFA